MGGVVNLNLAAKEKGLKRLKVTRTNVKVLILGAAVLFLPPKTWPSIPQGTVELLTGRYKVAEPRFKAVYPQTGPIYGLGLSANLIPPVNFYLEIKYFRRQGTLTYTKEKTEFHLLPISLGLRAIIPIGILHPFAGAGADFYTYYESNPIGTVFNFTNGLHLTAGLYVQAGKLPIFFGGRVKYTWAQAEEQKGRKVQLGGLETGFGLVFSF